MKDIAITENHLYQKTFRRGRRQGGRYVAVWVLKDLAARRLKKAHPQKKFINRIGLSVPKREDGAIGRNRVKRIIREGLWAIEREDILRTGYLMVISPRPDIAKLKKRPTSRDIEADLRIIFRKLDMYKPKDVVPQDTASQDAASQDTAPEDAT